MRKTLLGRRGRLALLGLGMLAGVVVVLLVYAVVVAATKSTAIRDTQEQRTPQNKANDETLAIIKDCTDPKGECYKRGQQRTAEAVSDIGAVNILAVVCALDVPDGTPTHVALEQVTECVSKRLNKK